MKQKKQLTPKQLAVLEDLFKSDISEQSILEKHHVTNYIWSKWQDDEKFNVELDRWTVALIRQSKLLIARYTSLAAAKLVQLTESENQETARKACLDILSFPKFSAKISRQQAATKTNSQIQTEQLSPETASRLLEALIKED